MVAVQLLAEYKVALELLIPPPLPAKLVPPLLVL